MDNPLDISIDQDLAVALQNLVSLEEHLFFTHEDTGKELYLDLLNEIREMRKELLADIVKDYEGEVWCISKHLLAASMRLMEVGTKALKEGDKERAKGLFKKSHSLLSLFFTLNTKKAEPSEKKDIVQEQPKSGMLGKLSQLMKDAKNCCKE